MTLFRNLVLAFFVLLPMAAPSATMKVGDIIAITSLQMSNVATNKFIVSDVNHFLTNATIGPGDILSVASLVWTNDNGILKPVAFPTNILFRVSVPDDGIGTNFYFDSRVNRTNAASKLFTIRNGGSNALTIGPNGQLMAGRGNGIPFPGAVLYGIFDTALGETNQQEIFTLSGNSTVGYSGASDLIIDTNYGALILFANKEGGVKFTRFSVQAGAGDNPQDFNSFTMQALVDGATYMQMDPNFSLLTRTNYLFSSSIRITNTDILLSLQNSNFPVLEVDGVGDIRLIKKIPYLWPSSQGAAGTALTNNGSGTLGWWPINAAAGTPTFSDLLWTNEPAGRVHPVIFTNRVELQRPITIGTNSATFFGAPGTNDFLFAGRDITKAEGWGPQFTIAAFSNSVYSQVYWTLNHLVAGENFAARDENGNSSTAEIFARATAGVGGDPSILLSTTNGYVPFASRGATNTTLNNVTYQFPTSQGSAGTALTNNGSGALGWWPITVPGLNLIEPLFETHFPGSTVPAEMTQNGGWAVTNALYSPFGSSGWSNICVWNTNTTLDDISIATEFIPQEAGVKGGLCKTPIVVNQPGILGLVDDSVNRIILYSTYNGTNSIIGLASNSIPPLVVGRKYVLTLHKTDAGHALFSWNDTVTQSNVVISTVGQCNAIDRPGVFALSGRIRFDRFVYVTHHPQAPKLLILGDSFTEGDTLGADRNTRYCAQIRDWLGESCAISSMGGENTTSLTNKLGVDLDYFSPQWVLVYVQGDTVFSAWAGNMTNILSHIVARGATPILATLGPFSNQTYQAFFTQANDWIRTNAVNLNFRVVDFAQAYSTNGNGTNVNINLQLSDGVHPNTNGHIALAQRFRADMSEIGFAVTPFTRQYATEVAGSTIASNIYTAYLDVTPTGATTAVTIGRGSGVPSIKGTASYLIIDPADNANISIGHYSGAGSATYINQNNSPLYIGQPAGAEPVAQMNLYGSTRQRLFSVVDQEGRTVVNFETNNFNFIANQPGGQMRIVASPVVISNFPGSAEASLRLAQTNGRGYTEFAVTNSVIATNRLVLSLGSNTVSANQLLRIKSTTISAGINDIVLTNDSATDFQPASANLTNWSLIPTGAMANVASTTFLTNWANAISNLANTKQFGSSTLTNLSGTGAITNLFTPSLSNATIKPIVFAGVGNAAGMTNTTGQLYGLEAGTGVSLTPNGSNITIATTLTTVSTNANQFGASVQLTLKDGILLTNLIVFPTGNGTAPALTVTNVPGIGTNSFQVLNTNGVPVIYGLTNNGITLVASNVNFLGPQTNTSSLNVLGGVTNWAAVETRGNATNAGWLAIAGGFTNIGASLLTGSVTNGGRVDTAGGSTNWIGAETKGTLYASSNLLVKAGQGTSNAWVGGRIFIDASTATTNHSGTAAYTNLFTFTVPGNTLTNTGDELEFYLSGQFKFATTTTNGFKAIYGSSTIFDTGLITASNCPWKAVIRITRTGLSAQRVESAVTWIVSGAVNSFGNGAMSTYSTNMPLAQVNGATNIFVFQGESRIAAVITNDYRAITYTPGLN